MNVLVRAEAPAVRIADGAQASPGDLITCTRNDHTVQVGEPGRTLANGDLLRIQSITRSGLIVRRALDADPRTGQRRWTGRTFVYANHGESELGYAVTDHTAQGRTVHTGLAVITGTENGQHAYVAMSRGTDVNLAYVFTTSPNRARPGARLASCSRAGALRPDSYRTNQRSCPGHPTCPAGHGAGRAGPRAGPRRPAALGHPDPPPRPSRRPPPGHPARDLDRRDHPGPRPAVPGPADEHPADRRPP